MHRIGCSLTSSALMLFGLVACAGVTPAQPDVVARATPGADANAGAPIITAPPEKKNTVRNSGLNGELLYKLMLAELSYTTGDPQAGAAIMLETARGEHDEELYQRATEMAVNAHDGALALEATSDWDESFPQSANAARYRLQVMLALGHVSQTSAPLKRVLDDLPQDEQRSLILSLPAIYQNAKDKQAAASAVENALASATEDAPLAPAAWTTIGRMRLAAGDTAGALNAATLGQGADPDSQWPAILALQLFATGDTPAAEPIIQRYLDRPGALPEVRVDYARVLAEQGNDAQAQTEISELLKNHPDYAPAWLGQGLLYASRGDDAKAERSLAKYLELAQAQKEDPLGGDGINQAHLTLAKLAERRGDFAAAQEQLDQVNADDDALALAVQRANLQARQGDLEAARKTIRAVPERDADDAQLKLLAEAQMLRDHGAAQASYDLLSKALQSDPDNDRLLYDAAMSAERLGRIDEMERLLRRVIALKPDAAYAYNALGYTFADRDMRLPEAKRLIEKAVQLDPDDSYIQDSLGWLQFRMGDLQAARKTLQAAYNQTRDAEIAAHLGEVLWQLGDEAQAKALWQQALRRNSDNSALRATMKRFRALP